MQKERVVISLGGSLIVPNEIDINFLGNFREIINKHREKYEFIIVTGGGSVARKYIQALREDGKSEYFQGLIGISITRMNARFLAYLFDKDANRGIPHSIKDIKTQLKKRNPVFCGGLKYKEKETSDATASKIAKHLGCNFINITNVEGLYDKDPKKNKGANLIKEISWEKFEKKANSIEYQPGQHFVLDQKAAEIIKDNKIKTHIIGKDTENLDKLLRHTNFKGTTIEG